MTLRVNDYSFASSEESVAAHRADHDSLHIWYNHVRQLADYETAQACIDDTPDYGVVIVPPGVTSIGAVDIGAKTITLRGYGSYLERSSVAGDSAWQNESWMHGSVLRSTALTGIAIDATNGRLHLENLAIVGANGLTTGIHCGGLPSMDVLLRWQNVQFANFATAAYIDNIYENVFQAVNFRGCTKGFHLKGANVSTLVGCSVSVAEIGIHLDGTANTSIVGGAVQGVTGTGILVDGSEEVTIQNVYFENANANYAIDTSGISDRLMLINNHTGTSADRVRMGSNHGHVWHGKYGNQTSQDPSNLIISGNYNTAYVSSNHGLLTVTGAGNIIKRVTGDGEVLTGDSQMIFDGVSPVLKSPDGTLFALSVANDGTLSAVAV